MQPHHHFLSTVGPHTLDKSLDFSAGSVDTDTLVDPLRSVIEPALDLHLVAISILALSRLEMAHHVVAIEQIDEKTSPRCQGAGDLFQHPEVFALAFEVAKRGEEVENPIEGAVGKRQAAHVTRHPRKFRVLSEQREREIEAEGAVAALAECRGVTPGTTGKIQNRARTGAGEDLIDKIDVCFGFASIPVGVEIQILPAEPLFVPGHGGNDSGFAG